MKDKNCSTGNQIISEEEAELRRHMREEVEKYPFSQNPDERYVATLERLRLDLLVNDPCWFVRHEAKRAIKLMEFEAQGALESKDEFNFYNEPVLDISDIVYALYVEHMQKISFPWGLCASMWSQWGNNALLAFKSNQPMYSFNIWKADNLWQTETIVPYSVFCGWTMEDGKGLYHEKDYITRLIGDNQALLDLYLEDMRDFESLNEMEPCIDNILESAKNRCAHTALDNKPLNEHLYKD